MLFLQKRRQVIIFKFQSDSINTDSTERAAFQHRTLNSNLILLIQLYVRCSLCVSIVFKFQSDSINT